MENKISYGKSIIKKEDVKMVATAAPVPAENQTPPMSGRFVAKVLQEFGSTAGAMQVTDYQQRLIQGYFISIDRALKTAEEGRLRKNEGNRDRKYDNSLPVTWANVNLNDLALDVMHYARMGLDMMQENHLFPIPYKNAKSGKYDLVLMQGYGGIQYIAEKYAMERPTAVTVELVYSTDIFRAYKKSMANATESYEFEIVNAFDRGEIIGGFGYIEFADPVKNKLIIMPMKDIMKRKPAYASAEFWGGVIKKWDGGKQVEAQTEGWFEEMCLKTLKREIFSAKHIPRDPQKVDEDYHFVKSREAQYAEIEAQDEIITYANTIMIDTASTAVDEETGEVVELAAPVAPADVQLPNF